MRVKQHTKVWSLLCRQEIWASSSFTWTALVFVFEKIAVQLLITEWSPVRFKAVIRESAKRYFCPLHSFTTEMFFWQRGPLLRFLAWIWFESCSFNTQASQALAKPLTLKPSHWSHCFTDLSPVYPTRLLSIKTALPIKNQWTKTATIRLWTLESFEINGIAKAGKVFKF